MRYRIGTRRLWSVSGENTRPTDGAERHLPADLAGAASSRSMPAMLGVALSTITGVQDGPSSAQAPEARADTGANG